MAKLVLIKVRDLKKLMDFLREKNYDVEKGSHAVLLDHSEVEEFSSQGSLCVSFVCINNLGTSITTAHLCLNKVN